MMIFIMVFIFKKMRLYAFSGVPLIKTKTNLFVA